MVANSMIQTGVDKLLALIEEKEMISLTEASKQLSVSKEVIEEWVNFLEEKNLIELQYKFTTPYLSKKKVSKEEFQKRVVEFKSRKEGFVRKVESTLSLLETETSSLKVIQKNFKKFSSEIEGQLKKVKTDLDTLEKYDTLKKDIDNEIVKQQAVFEEKIQGIKHQVEQKQTKYQQLQKKIEAEDTILFNEKSKAANLEKNQIVLKRKLDSVKNDIIELGDALSNEDKVIMLEEKHITNLHENAQALKSELDEKKTGIANLLTESKKKEQEIVSMQKRVLEKISAETEKISGKVTVNKDAKKKFNDFFNQKVKMDIMMDKVNHDLSGLQDELNGLINEAGAVDFSKKKSSAKEHSAHLEKKFQAIQKKKTAFFSEITKLNELFSKLKK